MSSTAVDSPSVSDFEGFPRLDLRYTPPRKPVVTPTATILEASSTPTDVWLGRIPVVLIPYNPSKLLVFLSVVLRYEEDIAPRLCDHDLVKLDPYELGLLKQHNTTGARIVRTSLFSLHDRLLLTLKTDSRPVYCSGRARQRPSVRVRVQPLPQTRLSLRRVSATLRNSPFVRSGTFCCYRQRRGRSRRRGAFCLLFSLRALIHSFVAQHTRTRQFHRESLPPTP